MLTQLRPSANTAITPGYSTLVTLDDPDVMVLEREVFIDKQMIAIADLSQNAIVTAAETDTSSTPGYNMAFDAEHGWRLLSHFEVPQSRFEGGAFTIGTIDFGLLASVQNRNAYRASTDLSGVTLGTNQQANGFAVRQREIIDSGSFNDSLSADVSAFPAATMDFETSVQPLIRFAVSNQAIQPIDAVQVIFSLGNTKDFSSKSGLYRIFFTGPAGNASTDGAKQGLGQYHVTLFGSGKAVLHERLQNGGAYVWVKRYEFSWNAGTADQFHRFVIYSDTVKDADGNFIGSKIMFSSSSFGGSGTVPLLEAITNTAIQSIPGGPSLQVYKVPNPTKYQPQPEKLRIEERRDIRSVWSCSLRRYYRHGSLRTKIFDIGYQLGNTQPMYIEWYGNKPDDTNLTIRCFDAETGTELTGMGDDVVYNDFGVKGFDPTSGRTSDTADRKYTRTKYYAVFEFTSTDGTYTPVIRGVKCRRKSIINQTAPTPVTLPVVQAITTTGQDSDPSHETAYVECADLKNELSILQTRSGMPMKIQITYGYTTDNPPQPLRSTIFNGYVVSAKRKIRGTSTKRDGSAAVFPAANWATYQIRATGEWQRLLEAKTSQLYNFAVDPSIGDKPTPYKITDIIRKLIRDAGYKDENIIVPDIDLRLFVTGDKTEFSTIEPMTPIFNVVLTLALSYLGAWIDWDGNATGAPSGSNPTKMGAWRLHLPPKPTFKNLAHFKHKPLMPVGATGLRLPLSLKTQRIDGGMGGTQPVKTVWVRKGSVVSTVVPPEANAVIVSGTGNVSQNGLIAVQSETSVNLTTVLRNFEAAKFFEGQPSGPNPSSPDYTNGRPVWFVYNDSFVQTQAQADFFARRFYDLSCHAQKRISFESPLILVTDILDTYQRNPRPLKYGDPVLYEGAQFIVASVNIDINGGGGSRKVMAAYEIFSPADLTSWTTAGGID